MTDDVASTRTVRTDPTDEWLEVRAAEPPPPTELTALDIIAGLDPAAAAAAVAAGVGLADRAGDLWQALLGCSPQNTARPALNVITDIALRAALGDDPPS